MSGSDAAALSFPPLLYGEAAEDGALDHAVRRAREGCDAGLVSYRLGADVLEGAMVFAPEVPLAEAMVMLPLCGTGFQNALGALAPPEVAVHLGWSGDIRINGGRCGRFSVRASGRDPEAVPDWLAVGFALQLWPGAGEMGETPDETALYAEGCAGVAAPDLLEAWARHTLNWIGRWETDGTRALHAEWKGLVHGLDSDQVEAGVAGRFIGVDERFGMLLRVGAETRLIPLTTLLEATT